MSDEKIGAIGASKSNSIGHSNNSSFGIFDREQWLQKQWEQGKTVWTIPPHAGGGAIQ